MLNIQKFGCVNYCKDYPKIDKIFFSQVLSYMAGEV